MGAYSDRHSFLSRRFLLTVVWALFGITFVWLAPLTHITSYAGVASIICSCLMSIIWTGSQVIKDIASIKYDKLEIRTNYSSQPKKILEQSAMRRNKSSRQNPAPAGNESTDANRSTISGTNGDRK